MSDSSTLLDTVSASQSGKETTVNALMDAASPATLFGRRASTTSLLTWGYYGGTLLVDGVLTSIANGTLALSASSTNYIEATRAGVVSKNTTGFTAGSIPLYVVTTDGTQATSYTDERAWVAPSYLTQEASITVDTANVTLTAAQARARYITTTGTLTANRQVILPLRGEWIIFNNNAGAYTTEFIGATGTGIIVAQGKRAILYGDGTNIVRVSADV